MSVRHNAQVLLLARALQQRMRAGELTGWSKVELDGAATPRLQRAYDRASEFTLGGAHVDLRIERAAQTVVYLSGKRVGVVDDPALKAGEATGRLIRRRRRPPGYLLLVCVTGSPNDPLNELFGSREFRTAANATADGDGVVPVRPSRRRTKSTDPWIVMVWTYEETRDDPRRGKRRFGTFVTEFYDGPGGTLLHTTERPAGPGSEDYARRTAEEGGWGFRVQ
jgi:hypothetical protein